MRNADKRIMIVEDDRKLAELTKEYLESKGEYSIELETRGDAAVQRILTGEFDLVILDIMLPGLDGLAVCKEVRHRYRGPILMLTALGDEVDQIVGLEIGADDYLVKPASPRLLLARVRTLLRRVNAGDSDVSEDEMSPEKALTNEPRGLSLGALTIDAESRTVFLQGEAIDLTTAEFDLLWYLAVRKGTVASREEIYRDLRGIEWDGLDRSVDQRIKRLRQKLKDDAQNPRWIKSIRGTGYLFVVPS